MAILNPTRQLVIVNSYIIFCTVDEKFFMEKLPYWMHGEKEKRTNTRT